MKPRILITFAFLALAVVSGLAQAPSFKSFDQDQFDTNGLKIRIKSSAFNAATNNLGTTYVTNLYATNITVNNLTTTNVTIQNINNTFLVSSNGVLGNIQGTTNYISKFGPDAFSLGNSIVTQIGTNAVQINGNGEGGVALGGATNVAGAFTSTNLANGDLNVLAFSAIGNGVVDDTASVQAAINAIEAGGGGTVLLPTGTYRITAPLTITGQNVNFRGTSKGSFIYFDPAAPGAAIKVANGASMIFKGSISMLGFACASNAIAKTAIEVDDVSDYTIFDVDIYPWTGSGTNNVGILTRGRQFVYIERSTIIADRPILIGHNPNSYLAFDQSHVRDCGLQAVKGAPIYDFEDGVFLSDSLFDGTQSLNTSITPFHYVNTTSALRSLKVKLTNFRPEQAPATNGYAIYIDSPAGAIQGLILDNCSFPDDMPGLYMRNCQGVTLLSCQFYANGSGGGGVTEQANFTSVDSTNYCERVLFLNCFSQSGGTAVTTGMTNTWIATKSMGGNPLPETGLFVKLANNRFQVSSPLFRGSEDIYTDDSLSNSVAIALGLHHTYTGSSTTPPVFGAGVGINFSYDFGTTHDILGGTLQLMPINETNTFMQTYVKLNGSPFLEADYASDHITFYPSVFNVPNINASSGIITPALQVTGQIAKTLAYISGSKAIVSLSNGAGVPWNDGVGNINYTTHPTFYNDGTTLTLAPAVLNHASLLTFTDDIVGSARGSFGFASNGDTNLTWNVNNGFAVVSSPLKFRISDTDTGSDFLTAKILPGSNITFVTNNPGGVESITIAASGGGGGGSTNYNFQAPLTTSSTTNVFIANNGIDNTLLRQGAATSVIGRSANSSGNVADIAASADNQFLQRKAGALSFAALPQASSGELILNTLNTGTDYIGGNPNASVYSMGVVGGTNLQVTLPDVGTYKVEATYAIYGANIFSDHARFYNFTTSAAVSPEYVGSVLAATSQLYTKTISKLITTASINNVIQLQFASDDTVYGHRSLMDTVWMSYVRLY